MTGTHGTLAALGLALSLGLGCGDDGGDRQGTPDADDGTDSTLYERLGEEAGITAFVDAVVAAELEDPEIAPFFANRGDGAPTAAEIKECLVIQIGAATGGPQTYPATTSSGFECRPMAEVHAGMGISADIFDKFVTIAAGVATDLGVVGDDLATIGGFLNSFEGDIVETTTLYQRLGEEAGITGFVDAVVAAELEDPEIAPFFAGLTTPTAADIKECLVLQISAATGGGQTYPGPVSSGFECRSMAEIHAGMGISSAIFDKFVTIAAGVALDAGVRGNDFATVAAFLNGTKTDIVEE